MRYKNAESAFQCLTALIGVIDAADLWQRNGNVAPAAHVAFVQDPSPRPN
jgi:hypothetical protein